MDICESFALDDAAKTAGRDTDECPNVVLPLLFAIPPSSPADLTRLMGNLCALHDAAKRRVARDSVPEKIFIARFRDVKPARSKECRVLRASGERGRGGKTVGTVQDAQRGGGVRWQAYARTIGRRLQVPLLFDLVDQPRIDRVSLRQALNTYLFLLGFCLTFIRTPHNPIHPARQMQKALLRTFERIRSREESERDGQNV
ncbi:hypothetical protein BDY19DRAFT_903416 [Irpex rosettiformis]|uniref:Uncharacterized protein n=1 Tax=Irpex rosettiformis TaxID=378272 RepID=A0ACB8UEE9_9APHY|nr:hypothetical protein BDY19DRAFT_903416 [Irpex rosettiformis]